MTAAPVATAAAGRAVYQRTVAQPTAPAGGPAVSGWGRAPIKEQLRADLTTAMKARDELRTATLRMVLSAVSAEEVSGKEARELTDDEVSACSAARPRSAGRPPRRSGRPAAPSRPPGSGRGRGARRITCPPSSTTPTWPRSSPTSSPAPGPSGMKDMGKVMGAASGVVAGRADGGRVAAEVRRQLG